MFCPSCRCEFRAGFTHCDACAVDLVADLSSIQTGKTRSTATDAMPPPALVQMTDYCGFLSLEEARQARDRLRPARIRSEIVIREAPAASWNEPLQEEYWIRVDASGYQKAWDLLGFDPVPAAGSGESEAATVSCSQCGKHVAEEESFCPSCGARFEDE